MTTTRVDNVKIPRGSRDWSAMSSGSFLEFPNRVGFYSTRWLSEASMDGQTLFDRSSQARRCGG
jgi:hypothetical protein